MFAYAILKITATCLYSELKQITHGSDVMWTLRWQSLVMGLSGQQFVQAGKICITSPLGTTHRKQIVRKYFLYNGAIHTAHYISQSYGYEKISGGLGLRFP